MCICRRPRIWETGGRTNENYVPFRDTWIHKDLFKYVIVKTLDWSLQTKTSRSQNLPFGNVFLFLYSQFCPEYVIVSKCKQTISSHLFLTLVYFHYNFPQFDSQHSKKNNPAPSMLFKSTKLPPDLPISPTFPVSRKNKSYLFSPKEENRFNIQRYQLRLHSMFLFIILLNIS